MPETSNRLQMPFIQPSQAQKHVTHNEALQRLDALVQMTAVQLGAETPPPVPEPGDLHGLGAVPTGVWAGQAGKLALWDNGAWEFITPQVGWQLWDQSSGSLRVYDGVGWQAGFGDLDDLNGLGIGTSFDPVNRLVVASEASLFTDIGGGHQIKETASLLFQSGFTGHAEMGLAGDNGFSIKVSDTGAAWFEAMRLDAGAQAITFAPGGMVRATLGDTGLALNVPVTGTAVQSGANDTTEGRILRNSGGSGAYGLGGQGLVLTDFSAPPAYSHFIAGGGGAALDIPPDSGAFRPGLASFRASSARLSVLMFTNAGAAIRNYTGGVAEGAWNMLYAQGTALGPVSQTAGMPTGALIETGSNANGSFVRFASGLQICTRANAAITTAPAAFVGTVTQIDGNKLWIGRWF
jgi:hypothetical protein